LDFGSLTAIDGYQKARTLEDDDAFGETKYALKDLLLPFTNGLRKLLPVRLRDAVPVATWVSRYFNQFYTQYTRREMVALTGLPYSLIDALEDKPDFVILGKMILWLARSGNTQVTDAQHSVPENKGTYNVGEILITLAKQDSEMKNSMRRLIANDRIRNDVIATYSKVRQMAMFTARRNGIEEKNLSQFMIYASTQRNNKYKSLVRNQQYWNAIYGVQAEYLKSHNPSTIQNFADGMIEANRRTYHDLDTYSVVVSETVNSKRGTRLRKIFDAKTGVTYKKLVVDSDPVCETALKTAG
jgi:hypothetical protein